MSFSNAFRIFFLALNEARNVAFLPFTWKDELW